MISHYKRVLLLDQLYLFAFNLLPACVSLSVFANEHLGFVRSILNI